MSKRSVLPTVCNWIYVFKYILDSLMFLEQEECPSTVINEDYTRSSIACGIAHRASMLIRKAIPKRNRNLIHYVFYILKIFSVNNKTY